MTIPSFALHDLGWHAFQQLCHTVLREHLGQTLISFLDGNDGGRDGAFCGKWLRTGGQDLEGEFVLQCKHSAKSGTTLSVSDLEDEMAKAQRLVNAGRCDIYLLMTNAGVTGTSEGRIRDELQRRGVKHIVIFGATWINQTIAESSRLRRLVPRLYGLGDLTQILDERSLRQARAVLDSMRADLDKLVLTSTYQLAAHALSSHGFVLLAGAAATGKTTIAAQLSLGAADEFKTTIVKLDSISDLQERWNPSEKQLFWLDDAFGVTQFDRFLAGSWTRSEARVKAALRSGSMFILTSRDYIYREAFQYLKQGSFPLFNQAQVIVDVEDLTSTERRQILYNHLRHGAQPNSFLQQIAPNLEVAAAHPGFTPELARRLGDPIFTERLIPGSPESVSAFFARPKEFLRDVLTGLSDDSRGALGLIFVNRDWLASPISLQPNDRDLLKRLASNLGGATKALEAMQGSLVRHLIREGEAGWVFSHPSMVDAYADLLRSPELIHHMLYSFPLDILLREISCGDVGIQGATVVPKSMFEVVLDRLEEPLPKDDTSWEKMRRRSVFLATRCDAGFLRSWIDRDPSNLSRLKSPGLMLEADSDNEIVARLNEFGLYPEDMRVSFADHLVAFCLEGIDPAVLWNARLNSILTQDEMRELRHRVKSEMLSDLPRLIRTSVDGVYPDDTPEEMISGLRTLVYRLTDVFPDDAWIEARAQDLDNELDLWVEERQSGEGPEREWELERMAVVSNDEDLDFNTSPGERSTFDDLLTGRDSPIRPQPSVW